MKKALVLTVSALAAALVLSGCEKEPTREACTLEKLLASTDSLSSRDKFEGACYRADFIDYKVLGERPKGDEICKNFKSFANPDVRNRVRHWCINRSLTKEEIRQILNNFGNLKNNSEKKK